MSIDSITPPPPLKSMMSYNTNGVVKMEKMNTITWEAEDVVFSDMKE